MRFSFQVVYTNPKFLAENGYGRVSNVPCIFDSRPGFHRLGSQYLIEKALGLWRSSYCTNKNWGKFPSKKSLKNYADRLCNFLEWCEHSANDILSLEIGVGVFGGYQHDMLLGLWSRDGKPLSERTINARTLEASNFLEWIGCKGLKCETVSRPSEMMRTENNIPIYNGGRLREKVKVVRMPGLEDLRAWRARVANRALRGDVEVMIVDLIMESAIRIEEAACWRIDTLPLEKNHWNIPNPDSSPDRRIVLIDIKYGTKGPDYGYNHGDKIGPIGTIRIPFTIAERLHEYVKAQRALSLSIAVRQKNSLKEQQVIRDNTVHLFLNPLTGLRYTSSQIYEFWRFAKPPTGWSPHRSRDYWACTLLWERMECQRELLQRLKSCGCDDELRRALTHAAETCIDMEIQPQLRHKSKVTTHNYLQWYVDKLGLGVNFQQMWLQELSSEEGL